MIKLEVCQLSEVQLVETVEYLTACMVMMLKLDGQSTGLKGTVLCIT